MHSLRIPFLVVLGLLACGAGAAAPKAGPGGFGTRDQLRDCLDMDDSLKARAHALEASSVASNKLIEANEAEAARLGEMRKTLDRSDKAAIAAFNAAAKAHNEHVQQADDGANEVAAATREYGADKKASEQQCGSLSYRPADMDAVTRERKKAAAAAPAP